LAQGFFASAQGISTFPNFSSVSAAELEIPEKLVPTPTKPKVPPTGSLHTFETPEVELQVHELQDLEENIDKLNSLLSGCDMRVVVKIRASSSASQKSEELSSLLNKIKHGWGNE